MKTQQKLNYFDKRANNIKSMLQITGADVLEEEQEEVNIYSILLHSAVINQLTSLKQQILFQGVYLYSSILLTLKT